MSVAQTLPNIPSNLPLWQMINQQSENPEYSLEAMQIRITSAQLLALKTTPVQLIAPPGGNGLQVLWIDAIELKYNFNTTAYTLNAGTLKLFYGPVANAHPLTADQSTNFLTAAASRLILQPALLAIAADTPTNLLNQAIYLGNDGSANYTLGDATLDVTIMFGRTTP
jgi:hypothetical protein